MKENPPLKANTARKWSLFWFVPLRILAGIVLVNVPTFMLRNLVQFLLSLISVQNANVTALVVFLVRSLSVYWFYRGFIRIFEKQKAEAVSMDRASVREFLSGAVLGLMTILAVMGTMRILGAFSITGIDPSATLFRSLLYHTFFAFLQDIVYFAIIFRTVEKYLGSWIAIGVASFIFGFKHLMFPGYTLWSVIAQTLEAGILFSALYLLTRRIWMILGFHVIWNFIQYGLVSGVKSEGLTALLIAEFPGPKYITGQPVGFEASVLTLAAGTGLGIYFMVKAYRNGPFMYPCWKNK